MNIDLTHPEILTIEQLQTYLIKFIGSDISNNKYELIDLFYKYIAPLPQRKFRSNRLGTILTNSQKKFTGEKRSLLPSDLDTTEKLPKWKIISSVAGSTSEPQGTKHESDRGIYTITMQKSGNKNTAPIKLKRPPSTSTTNNDQDISKRQKLDETNT